MLTNVLYYQVWRLPDPVCGERNMELASRFASSMFFSYILIIGRTDWYSGSGSPAARIHRVQSAR